MKAPTFQTTLICRASKLPVLLTALGLLFGCGAAVELKPTVGLPRDHGSLPMTVGANESPEFLAYGRVAEPPGGEDRSVLPIVPGSVTLFQGLVGKLAVRPVSSLHRLFFYVANTTYDSVKPASFSLMTETPIPPVSEGPGMDFQEWERTLDALTGSTASIGTIRFLIDGDQFFPALVDAVMGAQSSVDFRTYIFDTDDYATTFADLLKRRSEDVDVRVLLDGLGTLIAAGTNSDSMPRDFEQPGSIKHYLQKNSDVAVRVQANPWFAGDHTKTFIIDRQVAFVGGMNIGREYRYDWHDLMMEVRGPVVDMIDRDFHKAWSHAGLFGDFGYLFNGLRPKKKIESAAGYPIRVLFTKPGDSQIYRAQVAAIRAAKRYIYITNPYFSDDETLLELVKARRRGVDVRVILPSRGDSTLMDSSNVVAANIMFRSGIRVFLYPGFTHVKAAIYDGWACVGSANLDKFSLRVNEELNLATSHKETVLALQKQLFEADFEKSAEMTEPLRENLGHYLAEFVADQL